MSKENTVLALEYAKALLHLAEEDAKLAARAFRSKLYTGALYHAEQSSEKLIKFVIIVACYHQLLLGRGDEKLVAVLEPQKSSVTEMTCQEILKDPENVAKLIGHDIFRLVAGLLYRLGTAPLPVQYLRQTQQQIYAMLSTSKLNRLQKMIIKYVGELLKENLQIVEIYDQYSSYIHKPRLLVKDLIEGICTRIEKDKTCYITLCTAYNNLKTLHQMCSEGAVDKCEEADKKALEILTHRDLKHLFLVVISREILREAYRNTVEAFNSASKSLKKMCKFIKLSKMLPTRWRNMVGMGVQIDTNYISWIYNLVNALIKVLPIFTMLSPIYNEVRYPMITEDISVCRCKELVQAHKYLGSICSKEVLDPVELFTEEHPLIKLRKDLVNSLVESVNSAKHVAEDLDKVPYWVQQLSIPTESRGTAGRILV